MITVLALKGVIAINNCEVKSRIEKVCISIMMRYPFYGYLLMHMDIKDTKEPTSYTDMKSIFLNHTFIVGLNDYELEFVLLHEILHAALKHPINMEGHNPAIYDLAADIMVNTTILANMNAYKIEIGKKLIQLTIFGREVIEMGTEKLYGILIHDQNSRYVQDLLGKGTIDNHKNWGSKSIIRNKEYLNGMWEKHIRDGIVYEDEHTSIGTKYVGSFISEITAKGTDYVSKTEWQKLLREFLTMSNEKYDYTFTPPDRRYSYGDIFIPDYNIIPDMMLGKLWFCVDTSMSMKSSDIEVLFAEIKKCINDMGSLYGQLSFFDESVTEPIEFHTVKDINSVKPLGGRGTDFSCIFDYMQENMMKQPPVAIIVMTDGYADFPMEIAACGIPVLWTIIGNNRETPPWGKYIYL